MANVVVENVIASAESNVNKAERAYGKIHPQLIVELKGLANIHMLLKNYQQAKSAYGKMLNIQHRLYGSFHWSNAETLLWLGEACEAEKDFAQSEQFYTAAIAILDRNDVYDKSILGRLHVRLHAIYSINAELGQLTAKLKLEELQWRAAYSSFSKKERNGRNKNQASPKFAIEQGSRLVKWG